MIDPLLLQRFLRATAAPGREVVGSPPFTTYFHASDPLKYLNYAIPDDAAEPDREEIEALRTLFGDRDRLPRLEWIEEAAPLVAPALAGAGMKEELRAPLMACRRDDLVEADADVPELSIAPVGDGDLRELSNLQRAAFDQHLLPDDAELRLPSGGGVLARANGEAVSAAAWTPVIDGTSEIVGVATAEPWRGRGLAGALTAAATRAAFAAGAEICVLSPGNETAQRVYARAGFRRLATVLHWSDE